MGSPNGQDRLMEDPDDGPVSDVELVASNVVDQDGPEGTKASSIVEITEEQGSPLFVSDRSPSVPVSLQQRPLHAEIVERDGIAVIVPPAQRRWEYRVYAEEPAVREVLREYEDGDLVEYQVQFVDGHEEIIPFDQLIKLENGTTALSRFNDQASYESDSAGSASVSKETRRSARSGEANVSSIVLSSDDELSTVKTTKPVTRGRRPLEGRRTTRFGRQSRLRSSQSQLSLPSMSSETSSEESRMGQGRRTAGQTRHARSARAAAQKKVNYSDIPTLEESESGDSSDDMQPGKRKRISFGTSGPSKSRRLLRGLRRLDPDRDPVEGSRRSGRNLRPLNSMREVGEDDIPEKVATNGTTKYIGAKESFKQLAAGDDFRLRHCQTCDACNESGSSSEKGQLVFCQGCTISYHQKCLGQRTVREHLVTKIGERDFVLQCRRCIGVPKQKDFTAPEQGACQICHKSGSACAAFRERKTTRQEQKEREDNDGEDPVTDVSSELINKPQNVLFRCLICYRAFHMHHLPSKTDAALEGQEDEELASVRYSEYCKTWTCKDCADAPAQVESLVAWRPVDIDTYEAGRTTEEIEEDAKEYLVRWKKTSYFKVQWMPGAWVWGVTASAMRAAFVKRDNRHNLPKMRTEDAVPEDYLRVDIVLDIEYTNVVKAHKEEVDKARIKEVKKALLKFKGLGYEDVVWDDPPRPEDTERWADYKTAYDDWVMGSYTHPPAHSSLNSQIAKVRAQDFEKHLELKAQPKSLTGGELMAYQLEGLNWLYYQWHKRQNAILADEMGLGKTIQVIGFFATLKQYHGCWPFLVVVPNSTCPNWRREIKQWAPELRVVTYYGSAEARKLSSKHELFPEGGKDLRCHIVVTSYDAAQDEEFRKTFRGIHWAGLVVDEGQRLKSDKNILYGALNALKAPFKLLLTGTPLQNNARELYNLLQFLDPKIDAQAMEEKYAELTKENVAELHEQLRKFFLRRTKAEVLSFLPPMAQIILPVSMTVLQKKLYKSILAKNPELIKSIMGVGQKSLKQTERASLNNILMQLRKCLCHPFVYSRQIEDRTPNKGDAHRNLVSASSKLQLLDIMLPKLQERGHRVLIFSQFLDMLDMVEDFLDGIGLPLQRLDGSMGSLQKQKHIDAFNAPGSHFFAFLLSTRAGGVGINLATADTVIILDPDFNPHQDIQALSRAHRIGQKKKVLVFQLTTRASAEEKIMQIGKKKMALDHVLIEQMDAEEDAGMDLESILRHGTEALFKDDDTENINYDSSSVDRLLDRSQIEDTQTGKDNSAESQFSFARVWANDKGVLEDSLGDIPEETHLPDPSVWENILRERERLAAEEAAAIAEDLGRGKRKRLTVDYTKQTDRGLVLESSPVRSKKFGKNKPRSDSDTDFQARGEESEGDIDSVEEDGDQNAIQELDVPQQRPSRSQYTTQAPGSKQNGLPVSPPNGVPLPRPLSTMDGNNDEPMYSMCIACDKVHQTGYCPLKVQGAEFCNLCGLPHYGRARICPHINSITQLRAMLEAIKQSPEPKEIKDAAKKRILGIIGDLNQRRRKAAEALAAKEAQTLQPSHPAGQNRDFSLYGVNNGPGPGSSYLNGGESGKENRTTWTWIPSSSR